MNNFRLVSNPQTSEGGSHILGYGRHRDLRYKIAMVRGTSIAVYIGLNAEHPAFGANLDKLKTSLPQVDWSYASPDLFYANKAKEPIWWIGWLYENKQPTIEEVNTTTKTVIKELMKGGLRGEISKSH